MQTPWTANVAGGQCGYTGQALDVAHSRFKITQDESNEVAAELKRALEHYEGPAREKEEAQAAFIAHREEVTAGSRVPAKYVIVAE